MGLLRSTSRSIEISPGDCCVEPGEQQAFQATIHNLADQRVSWNASSGMIDENGWMKRPMSKNRLMSR